MQKPRVQIARWRRSGLHHDAPRSAAMIGAVRRDMREHFFARHQALVAIGERKRDVLGQLFRRQISGVVNVPRVEHRYAIAQRLKRRRFCCIGGRKRLRRSRQVRRENLINYVDVIEDAHRVVPRIGLRHGIHFGKLSEELLIAPGLVFKEGVKEGCGAHNGARGKLLTVLILDDARALRVAFYQFVFTAQRFSATRRDLYFSQRPGVGRNLKAVSIYA